MRDLGKLIVAKDFKKLPKVQKIAQSGHTGADAWLQTSARGTSMLLLLNPLLIKFPQIEERVIIKKQSRGGEAKHFKSKIGNAK